MRSRGSHRLIFFAFLIFSFTFSAKLGVSQDLEKGKQTIKGRVVAASISNWLLPCYHVCGMQFVIRRDGYGEPEYAIVNLAFMDDRGLTEKGLHWRVIDKVARWEFKATRGDDLPLEEFMSISDEKSQVVTRDTAWPAWVLLKGAPYAKLPYNQTLPTYRVDVGKFRSIK